MPHAMQQKCSDIMFAMRRHRGNKRSIRRDKKLQKMLAKFRVIYNKGEFYLGGETFEEWQEFTRVLIIKHYVSV